jgi:hypothetical protein
VAGRRNSLVMTVDDDRVYPRGALETYLDYSELLPVRHPVFAVRQCREVSLAVTARCIPEHSREVCLA